MKSSQDQSTLDSARTVSTYVLREPVKDAVKEALREESVAVEHRETDKSYDGDSEDSGRSKLSIGVLLLTVGGIAYFARKKMQSGDSMGGSEARDRAKRDAEAGRTTSGSVGGSTATVSEDD